MLELYIIVLSQKIEYSRASFLKKGAFETRNEYESAIVAFLFFGLTKPLLKRTMLAYLKFSQKKISDE